MSNDKSTIGVFFGSKSPEHDVSIITATQVIQALRAMDFSVVPVYIDTEGSFYLGPDTDDPDSETLATIPYFRDDRKDNLSQLPEYQLLTQDLDSGLSFRAETMLSTTTVEIDIAFPCFHGPHGEDGALHGLFDLAGIPVVGCGQAASTVAMDKALTKLLYQQFDIPTTEFMYFTQNEWGEFAEKIQEDLKYFSFPLFIKPARAGSSIGISRVQDEDNLSEAIEQALEYDSKVVVEEGVEDVADLTVALAGNTNPEVSEVQESRFESDFFSYDEKYIEDGGAQIGGADKQVIIPADIEKEERKEVRQTAVEVFTNFELSGIARVDFLLDRETRQIYANEINTMPGTLYKHLWQESGTSFSELLRKLIRSAKQTHQQKSDLSFVFDSPILDHANTSKFGDAVADNPETKNPDSGGEDNN
jgi:D-alanine-D-alanine ligase